MKTITLKQVGFYVCGISDVTLWMGGGACIEMEPFTVKEINRKEILWNVNDNGFGVQSVNGAVCDIYELYEHGHKEYTETIIVGTVGEDTEKYYYEAFQL